MPLGPVSIRPARAHEGDQLLALAFQMWEDMGVPGEVGDWQERFRSMLRASNSNENLRVFVAEHPKDGSHLIACGYAWKYQLLPAYWLPTGEMGYLQWFFTDPHWRKQGIASAILKRCLDWFSGQGVDRVQLHASANAASLYRRFGFQPSSFENLWLADVGGSAH